MVLHYRVLLKADESLFLATFALNFNPFHGVLVWKV